MENKLSDGLYAVIDTEKGKIVLRLESKKVPMTVANFVGLAEGVLNRKHPGVPFYDGLRFHRVIKDFMIQGGCPMGNGMGGPGYAFPDEFDPSLRHDGPGVLSMANSGPDTNGSQFFITHTATRWLDGHHAVFGRVVEGQDTVNAIAQGDRILSVRIKRVGKEAHDFVVTAAGFEAMREAARKAAAERLRQQALLVEEEIDRRWPGAVRTPSGLRWVVLKEGQGTATPQAGQKIRAHYTGCLLNGQVFDSSVARNQPLEFKIGQVIEGWNEALLTMRKGEKRTLVIPPHLGYGPEGIPGLIPPNSYLVFDVEMLDF